MIGKNDLKCLFYAKGQDVSFDNVLQVGRLGLSRIKLTAKLRKQLALLNPDGDLSVFDDKYADNLFTFFGAENIDSIDVSDYEGANIIHDMNMPIRSEHYNKYSCIYDGGCLEHVFNYPVAIKNCMYMVRPGGHLMLRTPSDKCYGHGFYQFSPELFYSLFSENNGFTNTKVFTQDDWGRWYEILPPKLVKTRVNVPCAVIRKTKLFVMTQKKGDVPDILSVMQSDYIEMWENGKSDKSFNFKGVKLILLRLYKKIPPVIKKIVHIVGGRRFAFKKKFYKRIKNFGKISKSI